MNNSMTLDRFKPIQDAWAAALTHPALGDALREVANPSNNLTNNSDASAVLEKAGVKLPGNVKATLVSLPSENGSAISLCVFLDESFPGDPTAGKHCLQIRNPFVVTSTPLG